MSMLDEGCVAIVPTDTDIDPENGSYKIEKLRVGKVLEWYPQHVKLRVYNEQRGEKQDIILPKSTVALVENPFFAIMNEPNSTMQRADPEAEHSGRHRRTERLRKAQSDHPAPLRHQDGSETSTGGKTP